MRLASLLLALSLQLPNAFAQTELTPRERIQERRDQHRRWRSESDWMLGAWAGFYGTPRIERNEWSGREHVRAFYGAGLMIVAGRYLTHWLRLDAQVSLASIGRREWTDRVHGFETSGGLALSIHGATFPRTGLGLGVDVVHAREANASDDGRFTWWGARFRWIHELMLFTRRGHAAGIQITPTFTYMPYTKRFEPGVLLGFNVQLGGW